MNTSIFHAKQLQLWPEANPKAKIIVPKVVDVALKKGATLYISISGGKDSQALLFLLAQECRKRQWPGRVCAIWADLGRSEWPQTAAFVEELCRRAGIALIVVRRAKGDLVARFEERIEATREKARATGEKAAPFWPDSQSRYCTSHLKSGPIDQELRRQEVPAPFWPDSKSRYCTSDLKRGPLDGAMREPLGGTEREPGVVISAEGVRADESRERAKKPSVEIRAQITASSKNPKANLRAMTPERALDARVPGQRVALNWRPLLRFSEDDVWASCGTSRQDLERRRMLYKAGNEEAALDGWPCHPAYVWGNSRLSCSLCILADKNDLTNGANRNPELYETYLRLEMKGGATFKNNWSLTELPVTGEAARVRDQILKERGDAS